MRALLFAIGSVGDVFPFLALGRGLQERGWQVTVAASPVHAAFIAQAGCNLEPMGSEEDYHRMTSNPELWKPRQGMRVILGDSGAAGMVRQQRDLTRAFVSGSGRSVVVASTLAFGARVARDEMAFPLITTHLAPVVIRCHRQPPVLTRAFPEGWIVRLWPSLAYRMIDRRIADPLLAPLVEPLRAEAGLAPARRYMDGWWHSPDRIMLLFPRWLGSPPSLPNRAIHTGFLFHDDQKSHDNNPALYQFLNDGSPPIAITLGSAMRHGRDLIEQTVRACTALGQRLLILSKDADQVPRSLPNTAFHSRWAPMDTTLPRCAALIHHGGVGTMARAFQAGIPQVVIPFCHDQPDNSDRVSRLGAGAWVSPNSVLRGGLKKVLEKVLNHPDMRDRCHGLAAEISPKLAIDKACSVVAETKAT